MTPSDARDRAFSPTTAEELIPLVAALPPEQAERLRLLLERGRRSEARLQLLQQVAASLSRTLDEDEILEELARGLRRAVGCEGVVVARVDLDRALVEVVHHSVRDTVLPARTAPLGAGPLGEASRTGEAVLVSPYDATVAPLAAADDVVMGAAVAGAVLAVPLMHGRRLLGVVALHDASADAFEGELREVTGMLARHAAGALSNARLFADSERERRQSEAMAEIARAVGESLKMGEVLRLILRHAVALLQAEGACVALREGEYLHIVSAIGITELLSGVHLPMAGSLSGRVVASGAAVVTNDLAAEADVHRPTVRLVPVQKSVIVPLMTARGILGVIAVYNRGADFSTDDARVLQRLADQVAVAVVNARLYEQVRDATREWSTAFDAIGVGMCLVDEEGRITRSNRRALQLALGTQPVTWATLLGRPFYEAMLGAVPEADGNPLARAIDDGVPSRTVCEGEHGRWLDILAVPHPNGGAVVTFDDASAQRAAWDRHRLMVEAAADPLCTLDREGRVIFANPAARALFGRDDLTGVTWSDLLLDELAAEAREHVRLAANDLVQRHEVVILRPDGERRVVAAALAPVREREHVAMIVASLVDVTHERRAREAVLVSEARYRQLFDLAAEAVLTLSFTGTITSANKAAGDILDLPAEQLLGRAFPPLIAPNDVERVAAFLRDVRDGEPRRWECAVARRNGGARTLAVSAAPLREGRTVVGVLLVARDVTEERVRTGVLQRSEARYAQLVETAADAIFTVDEEGNFTSVNRAFEAATGHGRDAISGHHFTALLDPRDRATIWEVFVGVLHGQRQQREIRYLDASGRSRWGSLVATPISDGGRVTGVMGIVRDLTAEKRLLDELLRRERDATVGQLLGGVVHELSNPLAAILAFSELLDVSSPVAVGEAEPAEREDGAARVASSTEATLDAVPTIRREAQRAARTLHNLRELTRERPTPRAPLQLADVVARAVDLRRYTLDLAGIQLEEEYAPDLPSTMGDAGRLQQAILHLVTRAEQSLRAWGGERRLSFRLTRVATALVLVVEDSGPGILAADRDVLFRPQLGTRQGGDLAGLGLAVADGIVREHGGRIHVDSTPGHGATFVVEIPIVAADPDPAPFLSTAPPKGANAADGSLPDGSYSTEDAEGDVAEAGVLGDAAPATLEVLVVDDEPVIRAALAQMLSHLGHRPHMAASVRDAWIFLDAHRVDRIILDRHMPHGGGEALLDLLRREQPALLQRVIALSGDGEHDAWSERAGVGGALAKPFSMDELRRVLALGVVTGA